jgi:P-type Ca2+ transporter type 2C
MAACRAHRGGEARMTDPDREWHATRVAAVLEALGARGTGLTADEARVRLARYGPNQLTQAEQAGYFRVLFVQFRSLLVWLLIGAAAISGALGEWIDATAIAVIVALNALIGAWQEYAAERSIAALRRLTAPRARVRRDARTLVIPAAEIVPGDVLLVEAGDLVAADARLSAATSLTCVEKALTGESEPVTKAVNASIDADASLGDRATMVYLGTAVANGTGTAVVVATGMRSEVGRIAGLMASVHEVETPLQARLRKVGRVLVAAAIALVVFLFALGLLRGQPVLGLVLVAVSLAVAAVPEGLPATVTVALAVGVRRMARRRALIRRLPAVETLGSTNVICTDKTGTLTVGQMTVRAAIAGDATYAFEGEGYQPAGAVACEGQPVDGTVDAALALLARNLAGCTNAEILLRDGVHEAVGDPTEAAMVVAAGKVGVDRAAVEASAPRVGEVPFDSDRKRSSVVRRRADGSIEVLVNGSPEAVLARCTRYVGAGGVALMDESRRTTIMTANGALAANALRVLACARRELGPERATELLASPLTAAAVERDLTFVGLVGMQDPPRAEAKLAIARCQSAGIKVVMITGDQPRTAAAIASRLGLLDQHGGVIGGDELQRASDAELAARIVDTAVFARVTAADKLRIVRAWQARRAVVAMTGDGVNDAPALRGADVGVAMGLGGTEVARQASDMVLTDDNFASIVAAVEEGRGVHDNVRKTLLFLLGGNTAELLLMTVCMGAGLPIPLLPIQILWINLVTDGLPALCLAADPVAPDVMQRRPHARDASMIDRPFLVTMFATALMTAAVAFGVYLYGLSVHNERVARTHAFAALVFAELLRSFGCRSATVPIWRLPLRDNLGLAVVVAVSCALQLWSHHDETLARWMSTTTLPWTECIMVLLLACIPIGVLEIAKWLRCRA